VARRTLLRALRLRLLRAGRAVQRLLVFFLPYLLIVTLSVYAIIGIVVSVDARAGVASNRR
jgi:hypothetical protein